jgi:diaminopimelate decarboxylase
VTSFFPYRDRVLHVEDVALPRVAAAVGTPFYCYSSGAIETAYRDFAAALKGLDATICYALKANSNLAVVRTLARLGAGADVVSEGELRQALAAGVPARKIVFAGVGKTPEELGFALDVGVHQINVESLPELEALNRVALDKGRRAAVAVRVNPDVDARTHEMISTGKAENKFGVDAQQARQVCGRAAELPGIALEGLAVHIGSQLTGLAPFRAAFERVAALYRELRAAGLPLKRLDLGGGLGIAYGEESPPPDVAAYAAVARAATAGLGAELVFEPGRHLVGNAGVLVTRVIYVKDGPGVEDGPGVKDKPGRRFVIVDAAMNDLIRPPLYGAWHDIVPVLAPAPGTETRRVDIVGPICESADTFARQRPLPAVAEGDLLAICSSGAYGAVMSSAYNSRLPAPEVLARGGRFAVVRPRIDYEALLGRDRLPAWLDEAPAEPAEDVA